MLGGKLIRQPSTMLLQNLLILRFWFGRFMYGKSQLSFLYIGAECYFYVLILLLAVLMIVLIRFFEGFGQSLQCFKIHGCCFASLADILLRWSLSNILIIRSFTYELRLIQLYPENWIGLVRIFLRISSLFSS